MGFLTIAPISLLWLLFGFEKHNTGDNIGHKPTNSVLLQRVHISVKTSSYDPEYAKRKGRVAGILATWWPPVRDHVWFVTDVNNTELWSATGGHLIPTSCPASHKRPDLCCKLEHEIGHFHRRRTNAIAFGREADNWFCHIDDDMYLIPTNLDKLLAKFDSAQKLFVGPTNLWPDDTLHFDTLEKRPMGMHHPMNGAYCMSGSLVDEVYPAVMDGGRFGQSCSVTPDDITLPDILWRYAGVQLTVVNSFHHQHSRNYKLPWYDSTVLLDSVITLYGYEDLPALHELLHHKRIDWWKPLANLTIIPPRGRRVSLGYNYCRNVNPPSSIARLPLGNSTESYVWCGPPVTAVSPPALEPLCESRGTYKEMHPTHKHTVESESDCPRTDWSVPKAAGNPQKPDGPWRAILQAAFGKHRGDMKWQYERPASSIKLWSRLAKYLAEADSPGTCCVSNPLVGDLDGGRCFWTAADQSACLQ